jgi:RimJ/RimL family protein N-acetyltransferase
VSLSPEQDLSGWKGVPRPERITLEGRYTRLEPLDAARHGADLYDAATAPGAEDRFRYLFETKPADATEFADWTAKAAASTDPLFFAVVDGATGQALGRQALMRIDPAHGVIEIGSIHWGPAMARSRIATEALYLFGRHAFETLGYRRFEWKCHNLNEPSKRAAQRFGFTYEGLFRQHMVAKGRNRDTAWFSIVDREWPARARAFEAWLDPANFDAAGRQKQRLEDFRRE